MIKSRTQSERSVVVVDVVLVVVVAVAMADGDRSGHGQDHGHVYGHDLPRLSRDWGNKSRVVPLVETPYTEALASHCGNTTR
jgi:hypothetical protein